MKLKNFIKNTLIEISEGIEEAKKELKQRNIKSEINPTVVRGKQITEESRRFVNVSDIDFDVAVIVNKETEDKAGIGVLTSIINAGAITKEGASNSETHRIKFKIPIKFS